jgi:hypothetical protein
MIAIAQDEVVGGGGVARYKGRLLLGGLGRGEEGLDKEMGEGMNRITRLGLDTVVVMPFDVSGDGV